MGKRIKITESQYSMIKENLRESHHINNIEYVDEQADKLYRTIASSTLLEVLDGDLDVGMKKINTDSLDKVIEKTLSEIEEIQKHSTNSLDGILEFEEKARNAKAKVDKLNEMLNEAEKLETLNKDKIVNKVFKERTAKLKT